MADFNAAAVDALFAAVVWVVKKTGGFRDVITHEPKAKPASLPAVAVWWDKLMPARSSGLSSTSGVIQFYVRVYQASMLEKPEDDIDKKLLASVALLLDVLVGGFTLTRTRSEEHTSELQSPDHLVCRLLLEKKKMNITRTMSYEHTY